MKMRTLARRGGAFLVLAFLWVVSCSIQDQSLTTVKTVAPKADACGKCHVDIYREWKQSKHALSYTRESFREQTIDYQVTACLSCHAPVTVPVGEGSIQLRDYYREEGVTCISCHLVEGMHHGPFLQSAFTPHATKADPDFYYAAALCGTCHEGTYRDWSGVKEREPDTKTCQQCHMAAIQRKLTQATGALSAAIVSLHEEHELRRHTFNAEVLPQGEAVEMKLLAMNPDGDDPRGAVVFDVGVRNLLPHSIPAGDYGFRKAILSLEFLGSSAVPPPRTVRELYKDLDTHLKAGETLSISLRVERGLLPAGGGILLVVLDRVQRDDRRLFTIAEAQLNAPGPEPEEEMSP